jgi:hypothetical protein
MTPAAAPAASSVRREIADVLVRPDMCFPSDAPRLAAGGSKLAHILVGEPVATSPGYALMREFMGQFACSDKAGRVR